MTRLPSASCGFLLTLLILTFGPASVQAQVSVVLPDTAGIVGDSVSLPVTVDDVSGEEIYAFEFTVAYDASIVNMTGASVAGTLAEGFDIAVNTDESGRIRVSAGGTEPLQGRGKLVMLEVALPDTGSTVLSWDAFQFNEGQPAAATVDGRIRSTAEPVDVTIADDVTVLSSESYIPVTIEDVSGSAIYSFDFTITYDAEAVTLIDVSTDGAVARNFNTVVNPSKQGKIHVSAGGSEALEGGGVLLYLIGMAEDEGETRLVWESFQFNEGTPPAGTVDGSVALDIAPPAPEGLSASAAEGAVQLTWTGTTASDLRGYRIYRERDADGFALLDSTQAEETRYTDSTATRGPAWTYAVAAVDQRGQESTFSTQPTTRLLAAPELVTLRDGQTAVTADAEAAELAWRAVPGATGYVVQLAPSGDFASEAVVTHNTTDTTQQLTTLQAGAEYAWRVRAETDEQTGPFSTARSFKTYPDRVEVGAQIAFGSTDRTTSYRLVALPGRRTVPIDETMDGAPGEAWRAFLDDGSDENFLIEYDGSSRFTFAPGRGFWLLGESDWEGPGEVETVALDKGSFAISVHPGWNIISNPFDANLDWPTVQARNGATQTLWRFRGGFEETDVFRSAAHGEAYYFFNEDGRSELVLPYPGAETDTGSDERKVRLPEPEQVLALTATLPGEERSTVRFGLVEDGAERPADQVAPVTRFQPVSLRICSSATAERRALAAVYRPRAEDGNSFDAQLRSEPGATVRLALDGLDALAGREVVLVDHTTGERYDLRRDPVIELTPTRTATSLTLAVGSTQYVGEESDGVPSATELMGSFPNPFREGATIRYALSESGHVRLTVHDVLGRHVATLVDEEQPAGRKEVRFEPGRLSNGVYVYRLHVKGQILTGTMMRAR